MLKKGDREGTASYIRQKRPDVPIISFSSDLLEFGDYSVKKSDFAQVVELVAGL